MVMYMKISVQLWYCTWRLLYSYGNVHEDFCTIMVLYMKTSVQLW